MREGEEEGRKAKGRKGEEKGKGKAGGGGDREKKVMKAMRWWEWRRHQGLV